MCFKCLVINPLKFIGIEETWSIFVVKKYEPYVTVKIIKTCKSIKKKTWWNQQCLITFDSHGVNVLCFIIINSTILIITLCVILLKYVEILKVWCQKYVEPKSLKLYLFSSIFLGVSDQHFRFYLTKYDTRFSYLGCPSRN